MKQWLVLCCVLTNLTAQAFTEAQPNKPPLQAQRTRNSEAGAGDQTLVLELLDKNGNWAGAASAFCIDNTTVVTCYHCLDGISDAYINEGTGGMFRVSAVIAEDEMQDVVVLKTSKPLPESAVSVLAPYPPQPESRVSVSPRSSLGGLSTQVGKCGNVMLRPYSDGLVMSISTALESGQSGSPVLDESGQVVGMVTAKVNLTVDSPAAAFAVPVSAISRLLRLGGKADSVGTALDRRPQSHGKSAEAEHWYAMAVTTEKAEPEQAVLFYQKALALQPDYFAAFALLVSLLASVEEWEELDLACDAFAKANPGDERPYLVKGRAAWKTGQSANALAVFTMAKETRDSAVANYWIAKAFESKGDLPAAVAAYDACRRREPLCVQAYQDMTLACMRSGSHENTVRSLNAWIEAMPHDTSAMIWLFTVCKDHGDSAGAGRVADMAFRVDGYLGNRMQMQLHGADGLR